MSAVAPSAMAAATITQIAPTAGTTPSAGSSAFTDQLNVTGSTGTVTYAGTSSAGLNVSATGAISTTGTLAAGSYTASGTDSDTSGDSGAWSYVLTVTISQASPFSNTVSPSGSSTFTDQLNVTGSTGTVTYAGTSSAGLNVSATGAISTTGTLAAGSYTASGTDSDTSGDSGTWTYTLNVPASTITQASPLSNTVSVNGSSTFTDQLNVTGNTGTVTFVTTTSNSHLSVGTHGAISTTGTLAAGSYTVSGTDGDTSGDTGTWTYTLNVTASTITQTTPLSNTVSVNGSSAFTDQLNVTGNTGAVTYVTTTSNSHLSVGTHGAISTTGTLAAGSDTVSGTDGDTSGDTGTWTYTLNVTASTITQTTPLSNTVSVNGSSAFTDQLNVTGNTGAVTYVTTTSNSHLSVGAHGAISTTGTLAAGSYTVSGTDSDTSGGSGTWTYTLTVTASTISQTTPFSNFVTVAGTSTFTDQLHVTGNHGTVTFTEQSSTSPNVAVSAAGQVLVTGTLVVNTYTVSGTLGDTSGDTGAFSYTLNVVSQAPTGGGTIKQTSATSGTTSTAASASFVIGPIVVTNEVGTVTFVTTTPNAGLSVSQSGDITTTGTLAAGVYTVSGTDGDTIGDSGTWKYSLTVVAATYVVTFNANGGTGAMAAESANSPTALTLESFTRAGYEFTNWNTAADGSGTTYADGSTYPFTASTTLYAQWQVVKGVKKPTAHAVTFNANGGTGTMAPEKSKSPAGLTPNRFKRKGFSFVQWNTAANGSGSNFANRAPYPFRSSVTLYAQWKAVVLFAVTFNAHGGSGTMASQKGRTPTALSLNQFSRKGFVFNGWSTAANGSGTRYANGAVFAFTSSTVLYAQWKAKKVVVLPPVNAVVTVGHFTTKSSTLSAALQSQIRNLAREIKANRDLKIALVGYGDALSKADQSNETKWVANLALSKRRATVVEAYLQQQLSALGVAGYTISAVGDATAGPGTSGPSAATKAKDGEVIATLT